MEKNLYNNRPLLGGIAAATLAASVFAPQGINFEPAHAETNLSVENTTPQILGSWAVSYSCQTDIFSINVQTPPPSTYDVKMYSNQNNTFVKIRDFIVVDEPSLEIQIPMSEAESLGVERSTNTEIDIYDAVNGPTLVGGTVVDTVGCPREPEPTLTPSPEPTITETPIVVEPTPTPTASESPLTQQRIKMPKKKYKVGKTIKMSMRTQTGTPALWGVKKSRNKKNKKVCKPKTNFIGLENNEPVQRTKIITLHPGKCNYSVFAVGRGNQELLFEKGSFRVTKKKNKSIK